MKRLCIGATAVITGMSWATVAPASAWSARTAVLSSNGHTYQLEVAITGPQRERGLSGRANMPDDEGMVFVYPKATQLCFWMKGMHFNLDVIWVSPQDQVMGAQKDLSPRSYPSTYCGTGKYVIELDAGQAEVAGMVYNHKVSLRFSG